MTEAWLNLMGIVSFALALAIAVGVIPRIVGCPSFRLHRIGLMGLMIGYGGLGRELLLRASNENTSYYEYVVTNSLLVLSAALVVSGFLWARTVVAAQKLSDIEAEAG